jgi:hypothetical protein
MNKFILDNENKIKTGFSVPEGYFENFEVKIPSEKTHQKSVVIQLFVENKKWILSTAAVLIISLTLIFQWNRKVEESYATEIENQLLYNSTISDDDIVNLLDEEAILNIKINTSIDKSELEDALVKENMIENYLTN